MRPLSARYPNGFQGAGLLGLRALVAASLWPVAIVWANLVGDRISVGLASLLFIAAIAGAFSPWTTLCCLIWHGTVLLAADHDPWRFALTASAECLILTLTGPGAYSYDAVLRGPAMLKIPPRQ